MYMSMKDNLFDISADAAKFAAPSTSFWQQILDFLQNEDTELGKYFVRQNTATEPESIIATVEINADLSEDAWTAIYDKADFWNESVNDIIGELKKLKIRTGDLFPPQWKWEDIIYANAAIDFNSVYVKPQRNIDRAEYTNASHTGVRGNDAFAYALNNKANLQFTHTQPNEEGIFPPFAKWLRLIMPKNTRRVEIEDLDRNFWVIGQSLSIISKYLFDDNSPLAKILGDILREITEQWENMLYLWADYAVTTGRNQDINLILDLPNDPLHPYRKFDGFTNTRKLGQINDADIHWHEICVSILNAYFSYLPKKYPKSRISLWVRQRRNNYYSNYFHTDSYPYYGYYDGSKWDWTPVMHTVDDKTDVIKTTAISEGLIDEVYGFNKNGEYDMYDSHQAEYPITALRVKVEIEKGGATPTLKYEVYDAVEQMIEDNVVPLRRYYSQIRDGAIYMIREETGHQTPSTGGVLSDIKIPIYPGEIPTNNYEEWM